MAVSLREYNNDDYPPFIYLFQPLEFRVVKIERRIDIVRYSFLAQRSITYLDLSTSEYSKREKRIFTTEAFRNRIDNRRRTLYKFHLDLTKELDPGPPKSVKYDVVVTDLSKHVCTDDDFCFYFLRIQISCRPIYGQECDKQLKRIMLERIPKSQNKIEAALKYARVLSSLQCSCKFDKTLTAFLRELFDDREHSALAVEFVKFKESILSYLVIKGKQSELDWALFHSTRLKYNLMQGFRFNYTTSMRMFTMKIPLLLGYGYPYPFSALNFTEALEHYLSIRLDRRSTNNRHSLKEKLKHFSETRKCLFLQLLFVHYPFGLSVSGYKSPSKTQLRNLSFIMKTVPATYFTSKELRKTLRNLGYDTEIIRRMCKVYQEQVCDHPDSFYQTGPRTLYHLAHCKVRECLSDAFEFPFGIERLDLVESCKESLRLTAYKADALNDSEVDLSTF